MKVERTTIPRKNGMLILGKTVSMVQLINYVFMILIPIWAGFPFLLGFSFGS